MAVRFDDGLDRLSRTTALPGITSWTIMGWVLISVDRNAYSWFWTYGAGINSSADYLMGANGTGTTLATFNSTTEVSGSAMTVGTWAHIATTVAGTGAGQFLLYLNGVLDITNAGSTTPTNGGMFMGWGSGTEFLNGNLAAIKIYSAVLTASEIKQEMRSYVPVRTANLTSWHPMLLHTDLAQFGATWTVGGTLATEAGPPIAWRVGPAGQYLWAGTAVVAPGRRPQDPLWHARPPLYFR